MHTVMTNQTISIHFSVLWCCLKLITMFSDDLITQTIWTHNESQKKEQNQSQGVIFKFKVFETGLQSTTPANYLAVVLSHGVVVEAGLGPELLVALLALQGILELQGLKAKEEAQITFFYERKITHSCWLCSLLNPSVQQHFICNLIKFVTSAYSGQSKRQGTHQEP